MPGPSPCNSVSNTSQIYENVLEAQQAALGKVIAGVNAGMLTVLPGMFEETELEQYFQHSTGHGLGLEVHELSFSISRSNMFLRKFGGDG
jgi:Xaa-Pro aminopeptidase